MSLYNFLIGIIFPFSRFMFINYNFLILSELNKLLNSFNSRIDSRLLILLLSVYKSILLLLYVNQN
jgi:hypothetical protein